MPSVCRIKPDGERIVGVSIRLSNFYLATPVIGFPKTSSQPTGHRKDVAADS